MGFDNRLEIKLIKLNSYKILMLQLVGNHQMLSRTSRSWHAFNIVDEAVQVHHCGQCRHTIGNASDLMLLVTFYSFCLSQNVFYNSQKWRRHMFCQFLKAKQLIIV